VGLGLGGLVLLGVLLRAAWPGLTEDERRHCRWLFLGAALSLLPVAATFPSNRLLLVPGLGGSVAVAVVLVAGWRARGGRSRGVVAGAGVLAFSHLVLAPLFWPLITLGFRTINAQTLSVIQALERELDFQRLPEQRVVTLAVPNPVLGMYAPMILAARGMPQPAAWWALTLSSQPHVLTRTGPSSFELSLTRGRFLTEEFETLFRSPSHPLPQGTQVKLSRMTVTVVEADGEGPRRLGFEFDTPLEAPSLILLHWKDGALRRFTPPPEGERVPL
jgi:hypothetical protein